MPPLMAFDPSGENATAQTDAVCPMRRFTSRRPSTSHSRTLRSAEAISARLPSGVNATAFATFPCASSGSASPVLSGSCAPLRFAWKSVPSRSSRTASPNACTQSCRVTVPPGARSAPKCFASVSDSPTRSRNSSAERPTSAAACIRSRSASYRSVIVLTASVRPTFAPVFATAVGVAFGVLFHQLQ